MLKRFSEVLLKTKCNLYRPLICQSYSKQISISAEVVPIYYIHIHVHRVCEAVTSVYMSQYKLRLYCDMLSTLWL